MESLPSLEDILDKLGKMRTDILIEERLITFPDTNFKINCENANTSTHSKDTYPNNWTNQDQKKFIPS